MFCGSATGEVLPPYVVYRAENMWDTWVSGGPKGARYNRSSSGWFERQSFEDWFESLYLPHVSKSPGTKLLVGYNLTSHFSEYVLNLAEKNNIRFACIPPNSAYMMQPFDVAFFRPLKRKWRGILSHWKSDMKKRTQTIAKHDFPSLLKELQESVIGKDQQSDNLVNGFAKTGLYPLNRDKVLSRLPTGEVPGSEAET